MELYLDPAIVTTKPKDRKPHPLTGKNQWTTNNRHKRAIIMANLRKGWYSKSNGKTTGGKSRAIKVTVYDLSGNYIETCESIRQAATKYGVEATKICACIKGKYKRTGSYQFRKAVVTDFFGQKLVKKTPISPYTRKREI